MIKVVVPISGGKDSQACLKKALEQYRRDEVLGLFCDTGWEHPLTYAHVDTLATLYGVEIARLKAGTVEGEIRKLKRFPAPLVRFCTAHLKIRPSKVFYRELADKQGCGFEVWYGMRSGESTDRKLRYAGKVADEIYAPHEVNAEYPKYLAKKGVRFRLAILDWSTQDVFDYLDGTVNPLYLAGFDRVGCFPCLASSPQKHQNAFNYDEFGTQQKRRVIALEQEIGKRHEPANSEQLCMFCHI
jgi:3'-phosphoadenosine 5'-phosphosulfate sulfotransferase (PAPS reductase)/FAD synthetase